MGTAANSKPAPEISEPLVIDGVEMRAVVYFRNKGQAKRALRDVSRSGKVTTRRRHTGARAAGVPPRT